ncbi:hypothetical protein WICPIJ_007998 [Wickerhamomyces pijperi]|uniref:P/Homo B domain-containing protein n=1 Tax=Wickerhamomyces pijperi TaxID=599730 RepID=A0A9P8TJI1_WICPI|nr:hypothetical protein WICPIJ_007998 [Wickerhamomyces pijperi]
MRLPYSIILSIWLTLSSAFQIPTKDHTKRNYFAIELEDDGLDQILANNPTWEFEHAARGLPHHYVFSQSKTHEDTSDNVKQKRDTVLGDSTMTIFHLPPKTLHKRLPLGDLPIDSSMEPIEAARSQFDIKDPIFDAQWHLINPSFPGNDVNVTGVWAKGITGKGIVTAIIDDGLDHESEDLRANFDERGSWDFNDNRKLPTPTLGDDYHGTRCAGEIAAVKNDVCGVGVAYDSKVAGIRILSGQITTEDEASALVYGLETNDIYSCSWGPPDNGKAMQAPDELVNRALIRGVTEGRKGKGAVYVYASGNGAHHDDNCNFDGYTNSIYSITVGALDHKGLHPQYSEGCSAVLVVTYSSGSGEHIHTTDIHDACTDHHGGTSAAAPLAAGVYSLVLSANGDLTWRDVQYLTILSSVTVNEDDGDYQDASLNKYSHRYGYGKLDAYKIVEMAETWENVNEQIEKRCDVVEPNVSVTTGEAYEHDFEITADLMEGFKNLEHIRLNLNMDTTIRGQVSVDLVSPSGLTSNLGSTRKLDRSDEGFKDWKFMSVAHWGDENFVGTWKLKVQNHEEGNEVMLKNFYIDFFGQKRDEEPAVSSTVEEIIAPTSTPTETETPSTTSEPTHGDEDVDDSNPPPQAAHPNIKNSHYGEYFFGFIIVGFIALLAYFYFASKKLATKRQQYEFDIIRPEESEDESEFDLESRLVHDQNSDVFGDDRRIRDDDSFEIHSDDLEFDIDEERTAAAAAAAPEETANTAEDQGPTGTQENDTTEDKTATDK